MIKNFDKTKYPQDHDFINYNSNICSGDYLRTIIDKYSIYYRVQCRNCAIFIRHEEHLNFPTDKLLDVFLSWLNNEQLFCFEDREEFDYSKVLSCAEVQIKNLLE